MTRFKRGKLAVLVAVERTAYIGRPTETSERVSLYVVTGVSRDGETVRKVRNVSTPGRDHGTPYVSTVDTMAAHVVGMFHPTSVDADPLTVAQALDLVTDGKPWMAGVADMRAALRAAATVERTESVRTTGEGVRCVHIATNGREGAETGARTAATQALGVPAVLAMRRADGFDFTDRIPGA